MRSSVVWVARPLALVTCAAMVLPGATSAQAVPAVTTPERRPAVQQTTPIALSPVPGRIAPVSTPAGSGVVPPTAPPLTGGAISLGGQRGLTLVPGTGVSAESLGTAGTLRVRGLAPDRSRSEVVRYAVSADRPGAFRIQLPLASVRQSFGGDWLSRVNVTAAPACAETTPHAAGCTAEVTLPTAVDLKTGTVTATVDLTGASGQALVLAASAGAASQAGSFAATSLSSSNAWAAGTSSGTLTWSYSMSVPEPVNDVVPPLSMSFNSGTVDGRSVSTNNQTSWLGEGFDLNMGFIERRFVPCSQDMGGTGALNATANGDQCYLTERGRSDDRPWENATLSLGSRGGDLVRIGNTSTWRLRNDDGTRVERLVDTSTGVATYNSDTEHVFWRVTTTDGTQYYFGLGRANTSATVATNSVWTVPVYGNNSAVIGGVTKYEPGYSTATGTLGARYVASRFPRAWRWNLDHVIAPTGDTYTLYYTAEGNRYLSNSPAQAGTTAATVAYTRGGYLNRIEYGQRSGAEHTTAGVPIGRVSFGVKERCDYTTDSACAGKTLNQATQTYAYLWPDLPGDQICDTTCTTKQTSPTFFTRKQLSTVTTEVRNAANTGYDAADSWVFNQQFMDPGDGFSPALELLSITRHGGVATSTSTLEPVRFAYVSLANRVQSDSVGNLRKWRLAQITSETGEQITWDYSPAECDPASLPAPESNTRRCFPQFVALPGATDPGATPQWFHKYVVTQVRDADLTDASVPQKITNYTYVGGGAWRYDDNAFVLPKYRTWSQWRGYQTVTTTTGQSPDSPTQSVTTFYRGMDGDRLNAAGGTKTVSVPASDGTSEADSEELAGNVRETDTLNGVGGSVLEKTINTHWVSGATANDGVRQAKLSGQSSSRSSSPLVSGGTRTTQSNTLYDAYGMGYQIEDLGDESTPDDDTCTRTTYVRNTTAWIVDAPSEVQITGAKCSVAPTTANALTYTQTYYDNATALTTAPTKGLATRIDGLVEGANGARVFATQSKSGYDQHGRVTSSVDELSRTTTTVFAPATGGPVTGVTTTTPDPDGAGPLTAHVTVVTRERLRGASTKIVAPSGLVTEVAYDSLGRLASVWKPGRSKANQTASTIYSYGLYKASGATKTADNAVTTKTLLPDGTNYLTSIAIFDGLARPRQNQNPTESGGRIVDDVSYDSLGQQVKQRSGMYNTGPPSPTLVGPGTASDFTDANVPTMTTTTYDGAGRVTAQVFRPLNVEAWRTSISYSGETKTVNPPAGDVPTVETYDAQGRVKTREEYATPTVTGSPARTTNYTYDRLGRLTKTESGTSTWTSDYDLRGRVTHTSDPDRGTTDSQYDDAGNLVTQTTNAVTLSYTYDALNRRTSVKLGTTALTDWGYDLVGDGTTNSVFKGVNGLTVRHLPEGNVTTRTVSVDSASGLVTKSTTSVPAMAGLVPTKLAVTREDQFGYAPNGALATAAMQLLDPSGVANTFPIQSELMSYTYDTLGRPKTMVAPGRGSYVNDTVYSPDGLVLQYALGNTAGYSIWRTFGYDPATRRLASARTDRQIVTTPDAINRYAYKPSGDLTSTTTTAGPQGAETLTETQCFGYDGLRHLTSAYTPASGGCSGDPATALLGGPAPYRALWLVSPEGNRTSQTLTVNGTTSNTTYAYESTRPHTLDATAGAGAFDYSTDTSGNVTDRPGPTGAQTLAYDTENHLDTITEGGVIIQTGRYAADGTRLVKKTPTDTTLYLGDVELTYTTATDKVTGNRYYATLNGTQIAVRAGGTTDTVRTVVADPHGTGEAEVNDTTGAYTERRALPFGDPRDAGSATWMGQRGFIDGVRDSSGLTRIGARDYDAALGRFTTTDPLLDLNDALSQNPYAYAGHNPTTFSDPTGLSCKKGEETCNSNVTKAKNKKPPAGVGREVVMPKENPKPTFVDGFKKGAGDAIKEKIAEFDPTQVWEALTNTDWGSWDTYKAMGKSILLSFVHGEEIMSVIGSCVGNAGSAECGEAVGRVVTSLGVEALEGLVTAGIGIAATKVGSKVASTLGSRAADSGDELLGAARAARDAKAAEVGRSKATVTGGYGRDGVPRAGCSSNPVGCAEDDVARQVGGDPKDITFTEAVRPRTGEEVPICWTCQGKYDQSQFPPGTDWKRGGPWDDR